MTSVGLHAGKSTKTTKKRVLHHTSNYQHTWEVGRAQPGRAGQVWDRNFGQVSGLQTYFRFHFVSARVGVAGFGMLAMDIHCGTLLV